MSEPKWADLYGAAPDMTEEQLTGETRWIEYGVLRTFGSETVAEFGRDRRTAEKCAHDWPGQLVTRAVTASEWGTTYDQEATQ